MDTAQTLLLLALVAGVGALYLQGHRIDKKLDKVLTRRASRTKPLPDLPNEPEGSLK